MNTVSTKPYLLRAIWEWCVDQGFTPYLACVVDEHTRVPPGYARDGQIVLNLSPDATGQLQMGNDFISFQARFGGVAHAITVPVDQVIAIYARENGQGMAFEVTPAHESSTAEEGEATVLAVVEERPAEGQSAATEEVAGPAVADDVEPAPAEGESPRPPRGAHLKLVK